MNNGAALTYPEDITNTFKVLLLRLSHFLSSKCNINNLLYLNFIFFMRYNRGGQTFFLAGQIFRSLSVKSDINNVNFRCSPYIIVSK